MTLQSLRSLRVTGSKPSVPIKVVVGKRIPALDPSPDVVTVIESDHPQFMDWRPVVGLPVLLFVCRGADALAETVLDALLPAGALLIGSAWWDATCSMDEPTKPTIHQMWELLCA